MLIANPVFSSLRSSQDAGKVDLLTLDVDAPVSTASLRDLYKVGGREEATNVCCHRTITNKPFLLAPSQASSPLSPSHSIGGNSEYSHRSDIEGQENFWAVVGRVFRPNKSKEVVKEEIVLEEEVPIVERVIVERRIGYTWVERRTWLDEAIKISNDNYGGGDGGVGGPVPDLIKDVKIHRKDLLDDGRKEGWSWSKKRIESARKFGGGIMNADEVLDVIKGKLFKKG